MFSKDEVTGNSLNPRLYLSIFLDCSLVKKERSITLLKSEPQLQDVSNYRYLSAHILITKIKTSGFKENVDLSIKVNTGFNL